MVTNPIKTLLSISLISSAVLFGSGAFEPQSALAEAVGKSGLPLPRFVSLKAKKVNMRVGPGIDYKVEWRYTRAGLPLEILQEYDNWRKVRDSEGSEGWISKALLSGNRTAIVAPWKRGERNVYIEMSEKPDADAQIVAQMEPGVVINIEECTNGWCEIKAKALKGYAKQNMLWGVYPDEKVK